MKWSLSASPRAKSLPLLRIRRGKFCDTMRKKKENKVCVCVCTRVTKPSGKQGVTGWVNGVEEDVAPIPLPVLYILKYTNVFN